MAVSSGGGHFAELHRLLSADLESLVRVWVVNNRSVGNESLSFRFEYIVHAERNLLILYNVLEFLYLFWKYRPRILLSTGAGPCVTAALVAKIFRCQTIYVETVSSVKRLSMTGRIMLFLADTFFVQWSELLPIIDNKRRSNSCKVLFVGSVLDV